MTSYSPLKLLLHLRMEAGRFSLRLKAWGRWANYRMRVDNPTAAPCIVDRYTTDDTWIQRDGAVSVNIDIKGGGGGANGGKALDPGDFSSGGRAGSGAGWVNLTVPAATLPASVPVTVGSGGSGGSGGGFGGSTGQTGSATTFGDLFVAAGGTGGGAGTGNAKGSMITPCSGGLPGDDDPNQGIGAASLPTGGGCPGGGGGGSVTTTGIAGAGGPGVPSLITPMAQVATPDGDGAAGVNGLDSTFNGPGTGGSGGNASTTGDGGRGGDGGSYGAGAGGGGAAQSPNAPGHGGTGGPGIAVITTYF